MRNFDGCIYCGAVCCGGTWNSDNSIYPRGEIKDDDDDGGVDVNINSGKWFQAVVSIYFDHVSGMYFRDICLSDQR